MREIKFRAWLIPENKYIEWDGMYGIVREAGDKIAVHIAVADQCFAFSDEIILEQYTGLHDKNGREIYEGDICRFGSLRERPIIWNRGAFGYDACGDFVSFGGNRNFDSIMQDIEVIGNIHEQEE